MNAVTITHNELGIACLEELADLDVTVSAIYTRPEQADISDQTDLDGAAERYDVPIHHVETVNTDRVVAQLDAYDPDLLFVVGWSQLVERRVLDVASVAALGMHPAPLPRGRGRAPIAWSLIKGLEETALSLFHLVEDADAGDLVDQEPIDIEVTDDVESLYAKVVAAGRRLIRSNYRAFETGDVPRNPQADRNATWWPKREPKHGIVDWTQSPEAVYNWIRGQSRPYPGAFSVLDGRNVTLWAANPPDCGRRLVTPGEIVSTTDDAIEVGAWEGVVEITELQVGSDEPIAGPKLLSAYDIELGDSFQAMPTGERRS